MKFVSKNLAETADIAQKFLAECAPKEGVAMIVGLSGDLGSGKTAFTQAVAKHLGIEENVTSPTFIIEKVYKLKGSQFEYLIHIDAYRLEGGHELQHLGWSEITNNSKNLIFLEWPEKVIDILPDAMKMITFKFIDENTREIEF
ncbi:MAG: tRNA (adenosine(37)-N6)-threonylcarbamoyltransferase complex ATPase subunit type 1 TsaE [bacterium]|nr:tRNA (adenosine(37)-N6)-threonylcarbamoyltransferase complex ATPase subunit type 1 TsaE [bacterium]